MSLLILLAGQGQPAGRVASLSQTPGAVTLSSSASVGIGASLWQQLGAITLDAAATNPITAGLVQGLGEVVLNGRAAAVVTAAAQVELDAVGLQSSAQSRIGAALGVTLDPVEIHAYAGQLTESRNANLAVTLGDVHLYAYAGAEDAPAPPPAAPRVGRGVVVVKRGRKGFLGTIYQPQRVAPPVARNPIHAGLAVTLGPVTLSAAATMGEAPIARRRRTAAALLLLN